MFQFTPGTYELESCHFSSAVVLPSTGWHPTHVYFWIQQTQQPGVSFQKMCGTQPFSLGNQWVFTPGQLNFNSRRTEESNNRFPVLPNYRWVAQIPKGISIGCGDFVQTPDGYMLFTHPADDTAEPYNLNLASKTLSLYHQNEIPLIRLPGRVLSLCLDWSNYYYHWLLEAFPRIWLVKLLGIEFDTVLVCKTHQPFVLELLAKVGVSPEQVIECDSETLIQAETLILPSLASEPSFPRVDVTRWVQSLYPYQKSPKRLFYLSRAKAIYRRVANESELINFLEKYGFEVLNSEDLTVEEQARMYGEAQILMGPHGSGLSNLVFCPEGAHIIEIYSKGFHYPWFMYMGLHLNLNYHRIAGEPCISPDMPAIHLEKPDFNVDIPTVEDLLNKILNP